jgi:hypothetical protein
VQKELLEAVQTTANNTGPTKRSQSRIGLARSTEIQNFETFLLCKMNDSDLNFKGLMPYEHMQLLGR